MIDCRTPQELASDPAALELARRLAASHGRRHPSLADEFEGAALLGLMEAATTYDPRCGRKFSSHACQRILGAIVDCQQRWMPAGFKRRGDRKRNGPPPKVKSLSTEILDGDGRQVTLADNLASGEEPVDYGVRYQEAVELVASHADERLCGRHGKAIRTMYARADGLTCMRVGRLMGVSESWISLLHKEVVAMLREEAS